MTLHLHLRVVGALLLGLVALHAVLPRRLGWKADLAHLTPVNRQIFIVHCLFICLLMVLMAALSIFATEALLTPSPLARLVLGGLAVFWFLRLLTQWLIYDWRLWWGKRFETTVHLVFTGVWVYLTGVYAAAWWSVA